MKEWYYVDQKNEAVGPHTAAELLALADASVILGPTCVTAVGHSEWKMWTAIQPEVRSDVPDAALPPLIPKVSPVSSKPVREPLCPPVIARATEPHVPQASAPPASSRRPDLEHLWEWVEQFVLGRLSGNTRSCLIGCGANIATQTLARALASYARIDPGERPLVLYDGGVISKGCKGLLITNRRVCWKLFDVFSNSEGNVLFEDLDAVALEVGSSVATLQVVTKGRKLPMPFALIAVPHDDLSSIMAVLREISLRFKMETATSRTTQNRDPAPPTISEHPRLSTDLCQNIADLLKPYSSDRLFVGAQIPAPRLEGAKSAYLSLASDERVMVLYDWSSGGTGRNGFVLTDRQLAWHTGEQSYGIPLDLIQDVCPGVKAMGIETSAGLYAVEMSHLTKLQSDMVSLAIIRARAHVANDKAWQRNFLLVGRGVLTDIGADPRKDLGTLSLLSDKVVWVSDDPDRGMNLELSRLTDIHETPDGQGIVFTYDGLPVTIYLMEGVSIWLEALAKACAPPAPPPPIRRDASITAADQVAGGPAEQPKH